MELWSDAVFLSRFQFAFTLAFHILFPTLTIGLSLFLVLLHGRWLYTGDDAYRVLLRFWMKIFALGFGVGVVSGIVLSFEFGTNFAPFSRITGNVLAPLLSYEVLMAFFLEASFLPVMLFGWGRVGPRLHLLATVMVALGTVLSAFWILSANSWMQTPAGYGMRDGLFVVESWWGAIFNPSFPYRLGHMLMASLLTTSFMVAGIAAWHLLRGEHLPLARLTLSMALWAALVTAPAQVLLGDLHGLHTQQVQPMKIAAMEGLWRTTDDAPFVLFAWPDEAREANRFELAIPGAASLILQHQLPGRVLGLDQVAPADRPPVALVFIAFRVMLYIGFLLLALALIGLVLRLRGGLFDQRWFLRSLVFASPLGLVAVVAGWVVTEAGRQPWSVQGLLRTAASASDLPASSVAASVLMFLVVYHVLLFAYIYYLRRIVLAGPEAPAEAPPLPETRTSWYPPTR